MKALVNHDCCAARCWHARPLQLLAAALVLVLAGCIIPTPGLDSGAARRNISKQTPQKDSTVFGRPDPAGELSVPGLVDRGCLFDSQSACFELLSIAFDDAGGVVLGDEFDRHDDVLGHRLAG